MEACNEAFLCVRHNDTVGNEIAHFRTHSRIKPL